MTKRTKIRLVASLIAGVLNLVAFLFLRGVTDVDTWLAFPVGFLVVFLGDWLLDLIFDRQADTR